jgi:hypothetical protein
MDPEVGCKIPVRIFIVVVLPAPFGPKNPNTFPCSISKEISSITFLLE